MSKQLRTATLFLLTLQLFLTECKILDFAKDYDSIPFNKSQAACLHNSAVLARALNQNASNNVLYFPENVTWYLYHGVVATGVKNSTLLLDGTIRFERGDLNSSRFARFLGCITIEKSQNVTITSQRRGIIDGQGSQYWGIPVLGYIKRQEHRPRLLRFNLTEDLLIENIVLKDSPYHTLYLDTVNRVEVRNISIVARRTPQDGHGYLDLTAFNTDGIDVSGHNVWVHDCDIWVQDDCIAVKDAKNHSREGVPYDTSSSNMTFERINATGLGFTIGSISTTHVQNITFRDSYLHRTVKGLYMKVNHRRLPFEIHNNLTALVEDILYENISMEGPTQWPIWIGPAQQADTSDLCHPNPCSLCWPIVPGSKCHVVPYSKFRNITLRNIRINNPEISPGVIYADHQNSIDNVVFENVLVTSGRVLPIARMNLGETFPGTRQPIDDVHVPRYLAKVQSKIGRFLDRIRSAILDARDAIEKTRGTYKFAAYSLVQNGGGAEQWYLSVVLQSVLGATWLWLLIALFMAILTVCVLRHWTRYSRSLRLRNEEEEEEHHGSQRYFYHSLHAALFLVFLFSAVCALVLPFRKPRWQRSDEYYACKGVYNGVARANTWPVPSCFKNEGLGWSSFATADEDNDTLSSPGRTVMDSTILLLCSTLMMVMVAHRKISTNQQLEQGGLDESEVSSLGHSLLSNVGDEEESGPLTIEDDDEA